MKGLQIFVIQLTILFASFSCQASTIVLKENVEVNGPNIFLGEIACLKGGSYNLYNLCIGKAALPGRVRIIDKNCVKMKLKQIGRSDLVSGAEKVKVTTSYQLLDVEGIIKVVMDYILERLHDSYNSIEIVQPPRPRLLPKGKVEFTVEPLEDIIGYHNVSVIIKIDGKEYGRCEVGIKVKEFKRVVVTNNRLKHHHILTEEDVILEEREITNIDGEPFFKIEEVIGKEVNRPLLKGVVLTSSLISPPPIIEKGDIVRIKSEIGLVSVSTLGKAICSGRMDEKIKVKNLDSKKIIEGMVRDKCTIIVE
ncbi:MAG: flagellar basal body P-ring formation chaperone FlgA [bacterium]|nr:flagellar basal body P-ring formation chaperone FlgA [bacterium]